MQEQPLQPLKRHRSFYLLPNLFTTGALLCGFYGIVLAIDNLFDKACLFLFVAMILDTLDGRVARLTNTQSDFGAEYDSLSDMVAFGIAPALIAYTWVLHSMGKAGWMIAFCYAAATALRLARFNVQITDKAFFQGLPCPAAAAVVIYYVWLTNDIANGAPGYCLRTFLIILLLGVAALMVSSVRFHSFKELDLRGRVPFISVLLIVLCYAAIALDPPLILFLGFLAYALSGPVLLTIRLVKRHRRQRSLQKTPDL